MIASQIASAETISPTTDIRPVQIAVAALVRVPWIDKVVAIVVTEATTATIVATAAVAVTVAVAAVVEFAIAVAVVATIEATVTVVTEIATAAVIVALPWTICE